MRFLEIVKPMMYIIPEVESVSWMGSVLMRFLS